MREGPNPLTMPVVQSVEERETAKMLDDTLP
jgi:hypothetical protein